MASCHYHLLFVLLLLLSILHLSLSIKCYACTTKTDAGCADPFNNVTVPPSECDISTSLCLKQILPQLGTIKESTFRGCVTEEYCKLYSNKSKHCSTCKTDYCNSAVTLTSSIVLLVLPCLGYFFK